MNIHQKESVILFAVFLFLFGVAIHTLGWTGLLVPFSIVLFYTLFGIYMGFSRVLMHFVYYSAFAVLISIIIFGFLLVLPSKTLIISLVLFALFIAAVIVIIWRKYNGILGRIQVHKWIARVS